MTIRKFRVVEWKNDFCKVRFKTSQPGGESLDFRYLVCFRKAITRSKRCIRGKVTDFSQDCMHHCESYNEFKGAIILVATAHANVIQFQPLELEYESEGKTLHYYPDILLVWGTEIWIIEVKSDNQAEKHRARFEQIGRLFSTHGIHFFVWKKSAIIGKPRYDNARKVIRYQNCNVSFFDRERIRLMFARNPLFPLHSLSDEDIRSVLKLVVDGMLFVDWWTPLSRRSIVSVWPIGRQEWPNIRTLPDGSVNGDEREPS